ncbi:MAG TPA: dihydrofolate reductase [Methylophilaceae bacterium]|nr:dihydrofolate reductase [Methylophilaceae bacterium]HQR60633.1 dihydrofolate reductase [Methylophilaceae bacterium]
MARISIIAAIARNGVIGLDNTLPWHLPEDLKRFRALTMGHHILMGRKTYDSLGRLLPGRTTVIVSRNPGYVVPGALVAGSLKQALQACGGDEEVFVIGGAQLYHEALPLADRLYLTWIERDFEGDAHFPPLDLAQWHETGRETGISADGLGYAFVTYEREATL